jgi:hypothetical protein
LKFACIILTHRRPDRVHTLALLERCGYTGETFLVVDDEDPTLGEYQRRYGDRVVVFSKQEGRRITDDADNTGAGKGVVYARNMCWRIAEGLGLTHFLVLDDDYNGLRLRWLSDMTYTSKTRIKRRADDVFAAMCEFLDVSGALSVTMSQGGDHIGGGGSSDNKRGPTAKRKAMNTFFCRTDRPFQFYGRLNEDVNAYVTLGRKGGLFLMPMQAHMAQMETQSNAGGLTEIYLDAGTYFKSFLSVMWEPSCVKVTSMGDPRAAKNRIHHAVDWNAAVPKIVPERYRRV